MVQGRVIMALVRRSPGRQRFPARVVVAVGLVLVALPLRTVPMVALVVVLMALALMVERGTPDRIALRRGQPGVLFPQLTVEHAEAAVAVLDKPVGIPFMTTAIRGVPPRLTVETVVMGFKTLTGLTAMCITHPVAAAISTRRTLHLAVLVAPTGGLTVGRIRGMDQVVATGHRG